MGDMPFKVNYESIEWSFLETYWVLRDHSAGDYLPSGTYYFTPKVKEGNVMIRVGYMDFMGAYFKLADLTFTVVDE